MGSIGLLYSILQSHLTNAWLSHRWKLRLLVYGLGFGTTTLFAIFRDQLWVQVFVVVIVVAANTIFSRS